MAGMKKKRITSIRAKLILSLFSVVLITGLASLIINLRIINTNIIGQAYDTIQSDLNTAESIYNDQIQDMHLFIKHASYRSIIQKAAIKKDKNVLMKTLGEINDELDFDILNVTDSKGRVILRYKNRAVFGDDLSSDNYVEYVLKKKKSCFGTDVIKHDFLLREGNSLAQQAHIEIKATKMGKSRGKLYENRGMALKAASPIFFNGRLIGVIYGARLLNNDFKFVDRIKNMVFKDEKIRGFDLGAATIFLGDVRISTNVKNKDGSRAVGTQVSEVVFNKVFKNAQLWLDKAFVVNNWYISAYSPIYDINREVIGILYVGALEDKYNNIKNKTTILSILIIILTGFLAMVLAINLIQVIIKPINNLISFAKKVTEGNYDSRIEHSDDEIGYLCFTFNSMIDAIVERDTKLKEQTQNQIVQSEKLASLGRLASGIAHEINNPLTGVLTYSSLLLENFEGTEYEEDINVIVNETLRCRKTVKGILDFARETRLEKEPASINRLISDSLQIIEKHVNFHNIKIEKNLADDIPVLDLDTNQMKSVINNLVLNAGDAMPDGGKLSVSTSYDSELGQVIIGVEDTGIGISEENMKTIFDPFFTTKETGKGTGLGLAVTYGIIERHNGVIQVESEPGKGTGFRIVLPVV